MPPVNLLIKPVSGLCNMKCDYCFYCDEVKKRKQASCGFMSESTLKNVIRKAVLYAEGGCTIAFQGGEPTLRGLKFYEQMIRYVEQYNKNGIPVNYAFQTNGYEINEDWCKFFHDHLFLVGLSVDGTEEIHDRYRHDSQNNKTYKKVLKTAKLLDKYQVEYNILTVVTQQTAIHIDRIYHEYKKRGWHYLQFIACLDPLGEERGMKEYSLLPEHYGKYLTNLFDLWYTDWKLGKQPYIRQFENYVGILAGYNPEACEHRGVCGIQNVIEADGSVYPCDFYVLDDYVLGNLNVNSMNDIMKKGLEIGFTERSHNISDECRNCRWFFLCRGGCYRNKEGLKENYFCKGYQYFFDQSYHRLVEIAKGLHGFIEV